MVRIVTGRVFGNHLAVAQEKSISKSLFSTIVLAMLLSSPLLPGISKAAVSVDVTGFNPSANDDVRAISQQADGKVLIAGDFTTVNGTARNRIARLNADGSLDTSFDPGTGVNARIHTIFQQADGKVLIGGEFTSVNGTARSRIARLNADGSVDAGFDPGADNTIFAISQQADGKILIGGSFTSVGGTARSGSARLNSDGSLDTSFDPGAGVDSPVLAFSLQVDGKVLISGNFTSVDGTMRNGIARLNADGSLDTDFDPGTGANSFVFAVSKQTDGKVLIGGEFTSVDGTPRNRIARLNTDGSLDNSFDPGTGANNSVLAISQQADGKVLIGGFFANVNGTARNRIARLNVDGSLDSGFDPGTGANNAVLAVSQQANGGVLIGGFFTSADGTTRNRIALLNSNGNLDRGFDPGGGPDNIVFAVSQQVDGKILIGGNFTNVDGTARSRIARLNADGSLDTGFNPGIGANNIVRAIYQQADGKVLIGGEFTSVNGTARNRIARLNADGSLDNSFDPGANNIVFAMSEQADGKVLIGGNFTSVNGTARNGIARLNANGSLDTSFDPGVGANESVSTIFQQADGKVLIGGNFTSVNGTVRNRIARLNDDGSHDNSFDPGTGANGFVFAVFQQADGKVLMGGAFTGVNGTVRNRIARLNADGSLDTGFDPGTGPSNIVFSVLQQLDGKVLMGGDFINVDGTVRNRIARLNADGSLDTGFDPGTGASAGVLALSQQDDGKVLIGGFFTGVNGTARNRIARLVSDEAALQALSSSADGTTIHWDRGGISPTFERTTFEFSTSPDGGWTLLGEGERSVGGWQIEGQSLPAGVLGYLRARGYFKGGYQNGSGSVTESIRQFYLTRDAGELCVLIRSINGNFAVVCF